MFGVEPFQKIVVFRLLSGSENGTNALIDVLANGVVLGLGLILTLLEDAVEAIVPIIHDRLDLGLLLRGQLQLLGDPVDKGLAARGSTHAADEQCAQDPDDASQHQDGYHQTNGFYAGTLNGHWRCCKLPEARRPALSAASSVR